MARWTYSLEPISRKPYCCCVLPRFASAIAVGRDGAMLASRGGDFTLQNHLCAEAADDGGARARPPAPARLISSHLLYVESPRPRPSVVCGPWSMNHA